MKGSDIGAQAKKERIKEKCRILRIKRETPSALEKAALAWKKNKEAEEREKQKERLQKESEQSFDFQKFSARQTIQHNEEKLFEDTSWNQYKPLQKEENEKEQISLNTATVRAMAKKLIAREWRRALGKSQSSGFDRFESAASSWMKREEEQERRKEEKKQKISWQKKILKMAFYQFGQMLRQEKNTIKPEEAADLLEEALENVGEVFDIEWHKQACYIWLEPWEEKKNRKISGDSLPAVYRAKIDQDLNLASYEQVDREDLRLKMTEKRLHRPLRDLLVNDEQEAREVLEQALSKMGRVIDLKKTKGGWTASIEPWAEMSVRNIRNRGKGPVASRQIEIYWAEGKFDFAAK